MVTEGMQMTAMLDATQHTLRGPRLIPPYRGDQVGYRHGRAVPVSVRPSRGALAYRGTGVKVSRAPHRRRPVSVAMTVTLAAVAALITMWLISIAQARGGAAADSSVPAELAVVQVQPGENLQQLAARVAPGAPVSSVVEKIKNLNQLDSAALDAGQTLVAPVG